MKTIKIIVLCLGILCLHTCLLAQQTAIEKAKRMGRGINLGNTLDAETYEGGWAPVASERDFDAFKEAGFDCVRIPVTWHCRLSETDPTLRISDKAPYTIHPVFLKRLDEVVQWSLDRSFVTIINVHHDHWIKCAKTHAQNLARFRALWQQLSSRYQNYPEDLLFEILNEPHHETDGKENGLTQKQVDVLNKEILALIRKTNPTRIVVYSGTNWGGLSELEKTIVPDDTDKYLMATYHTYSPWPYAGEGKGSWGTDEDKKAMDNEFTRLKAYQEKYQVPVLIGEFGAQHQCEYNSRMLHYACNVENIRRYQVASATWDDCGYRFKVYDRTTGVWDDAKDILIHYTPQAPHKIQLTIQDGLWVDVEWTNRAQSIKRLTIEKREGRIGVFKKIASIKAGQKYVDKAPKKNQTDYYYRVVCHLPDSTKMISYPQKVYIP